MPIAGIDFDETLFYTLTAWGEAYMDRTGHYFRTPSRYDFSDIMSAEQLKELWAARTPDIYRSEWVRPRGDARWLVEWFLAHGWTVAVLTMDTRPFAQVKAELLRRWFPKLAGCLVLAKDKWGAVPGMDILVDDNPASGATAYPAMPYNEGVDPHLRYHDLRQLPRRMGLAEWRVDSYLKSIGRAPVLT